MAKRALRHVLLQGGIKAMSCALPATTYSQRGGEGCWSSTDHPVARCPISYFHQRQTMPERARFASVLQHTIWRSCPSPFFQPSILILIYKTRSIKSFSTTIANARARKIRWKLLLYFRLSSSLQGVQRTGLSKIKIDPVIKASFCFIALTAWQMTKTKTISFFFLKVANSSVQN